MSDTEQRDARREVTANEMQVGGTHYNSPMQHWDFVVANNLDYFQAQITKYVTRWKKKGGIQDLEKARHFLDKYIEVARTERRGFTTEQRTKEVEAFKQGLSYEAPRIRQATPEEVADLKRDLNSKLNQVPGDRVATWKGFTYEGTKGGVEEYTCVYCRTRVYVNPGLDPYGEHQVCPAKQARQMNLAGTEASRQYVDQNSETVPSPGAEGRQ